MPLSFNHHLAEFSTLKPNTRDCFTLTRYVYHMTSRPWTCLGIHRVQSAQWSIRNLMQKRLLVIQVKVKYYTYMRSMPECNPDYRVAVCASVPFFLLSQRSFSAPLALFPYPITPFPLHPSFHYSHLKRHLRDLGPHFDEPQTVHMILFHVRPVFVLLSLEHSDAMLRSTSRADDEKLQCTMLGVPAQ